MNRKKTLICIFLFVVVLQGCFLLPKVSVIVTPNYDPRLPIVILAPQDRFGGEVVSRIRHELLSAGYKIGSEEGPFYELHIGYSIVRNISGTPMVINFSATLEDSRTGEVVVSAKKTGMKDNLYSVLDTFLNEFIRATR